MAPQDIPISDSAAASAANSAAGSSSARLVCPGCAAPGAVELEEFRTFGRVTSDCRAWPAGGRLAVCEACGLVFKPFDAAFRREAEEIYASYAIYHQSGGREQRVRHPRTGDLVPRSAVLAEMLSTSDGSSRTNALPAHGSLLDVGCGNGAFLRAFTAVRPGWELRGTEHDRRHAAELEKIPGFRELLSEDLSELKNPKFDLISLIHVLEHTSEPVAWLVRLKDLLAPDGTLFVECPDAELNPFDLLTVDHALHFSRRTLEAVSERAGLEIRFSEKPWIAKELSAVCRAASSSNPPNQRRIDHKSNESLASPGKASDKADANDVRRKLAWLGSLLEQARSLSAHGPIGCFGTSIAGTWLAGELGGRIGFFVDEDPDRAGTNYLGRPVRRPDTIAAGSSVFVALAPEVALPAAGRLASAWPKIRWIAPTRLEKIAS